MTRDPSHLASRTFDLLIVGGGIMGAGIAWDAASRGLSCALVEQGDFAGGASSKTTKLIHGGIRYLEQLDFGLVRQSIRERGRLLQIAPHLVKPLPFLIPVAGDSPRPWPWVWAGVTLYDFLAGENRVRARRFLNAGEMTDEEPVLSGVPAARGALYHDAQMDDARLVLAVLQAAHAAGAQAVNHCSVVRWILQAGKVSGAEVEDRVSGRRYTVKAGAVVNAAGPWVDRLRRLADPAAQPIVRPSKGIHLVYPDLGLKHALLLAAPQDHRIFFLIPWRNLTLIGTTDTDYSGDPSQAQAAPEDVEYLMAQTNRLLPRLRLEKTKVISTFAGVRPLMAQEKKDPWAVGRGHLIHEDKNGLVSLAGGKFTTFRRVAEEVVDLLAKRFPEKKLASCCTARSPLGQALTPGSVQAPPLCPHHPFTQEDVRRAVQEEMAVTLSDLLWRRLQVGHSPCHGLDGLQAAAETMGGLLGWSAGEVNRQVERYRQEVEESRSALG
ncbi:MAG: glycerol-3-phosphate dehydrogenase/oxidase [Candidatus Omnitrophica bacterium]|nr:glycerol-3-phosphate dehydrogenase/oxidase [Candidatus Omnitrophota bacterium]